VYILTIFFPFLGESSDGRNVCVSAPRSAAKGDRGGASERSGARRLLRVQAAREHRNLRDTGFRFWSKTWHVSLPDYNTASRRKNKNDARSAEAISHQVPQGV